MIKPQKKTLINGDNNVLDKEFNVMVIKMLTNLGRRMDEHSENFIRDRKYKKVLKRSHGAGGEKKAEVKTTLERFNSKLEETDEVVSQKTGQWISLKENSKIKRNFEK